MEGEVNQPYKYLVVSYLDDVVDTRYYRYSRSSKFDTIRLCDKEEVLNHIFGLELHEALSENYIKWESLAYDHYIYTKENTFGPDYDEYGDYIDYDGPYLPASWQEAIISRVNADLTRRQAEKEAARLAKAREVAIMNEQEEMRQYELLSKKYGGFKNL